MEGEDFWIIFMVEKVRQPEGYAARAHLLRGQTVWGLDLAG